MAVGQITAESVTVPEIACRLPPPGNVPVSGSSGAATPSPEAFCPTPSQRVRDGQATPYSTLVPATGWGTGTCTATPSLELVWPATRHSTSEEHAASRRNSVPAMFCALWPLTT